MEIPDIKQNLSILKVLAHYNLVPDKNNLLKCPFHEDKTASLQVYPKTNTYHCFGCGKTGDVIQWIEDYEKCTKHEAILKAKEQIGIVKLPKETKSQQNMQETLQNSNKACSAAKRQKIIYKAEILTLQQMKSATIQPKAGQAPAMVTTK